MKLIPLIGLKVFLDTARERRGEEDSGVCVYVCAHVYVWVYWKRMVPVQPFQSEQGGCDLVKQEVKLYFLPDFNSFINLN